MYIHHANDNVIGWCRTLWFTMLLTLVLEYLILTFLNFFSKLALG